LKAVLDEGPDASAASSRVRGRITAHSSQWLLQLEITENGQRLTRLIQARRCDDLAEAAAIAIALAFGHELPISDADRASPPDQSVVEAPASGPTREAAPLEEPEAAAAPAVDEATTASWLSDIGLSVTAGVALDVNTLPDPSPGLSVESRARLAPFELGLYGLMLSGADVSLRRSGAVDFGLLAGGVRGCYKAWTGTAGAAGCLGFEMGQFRATGVDLSSSRQVDDWWLAPSAALELGASLLGDLQAQMRTEALVPLVRKHYVVDGTDAVYQPPGLGLRFYVGLTLATD